MHRRQTIPHEVDRNIVIPDEHAANEAALLVGAVKRNLDVALERARREAMRLVAVRLALLVGVARGAGRADTSQHKGDLRVLLGEEELEAGAGGHKVDDGVVLPVPLPGGEVLRGPRVVLARVHDARERHLLGRVQTLGLARSGLLGQHKLVKLHAAVLIVAAVPQHSSQALLDELLRDVVLVAAVLDRDALALVVLAVLGLDVVDVHVDDLADEALAEELLGLGGVVRVLSVGTARAAHRRKLHTAVLGRRVALGDDGKLVGTPDADDGGVKRLALGRGSGGGAASAVRSLGGTVALPQAHTALLGRLLSRAQLLETTVWREDACVPLLSAHVPAY